jgi:predicted amidohydrolase YtcJ
VGQRPAGTCQPQPEGTRSRVGAIRGEHIVAVGSSKEVIALAGRETRRIDLGGRTVISGVNDAHDHLDAGPDSYDLPI